MVGCEVHNHTADTSQDAIDGGTALEEGARGQQHLATQIPDLSDDKCEMILPLSPLTWISNSTLTYPLTLQSSSFFVALPANPQPLHDLEHGLESGAPCRVDWQEDPSTSPPEPCSAEGAMAASAQYRDMSEVTVW